MRKLFIPLTLIFLTTTPVYAKDPCATVLCMAGMLQGSGIVSNCSKPVKDYFSIIKYKHGGISWSRTVKSRGKFLNKCPSAGNWAGDINKKYGRVL